MTEHQMGLKDRGWRCSSKSLLDPLWQKDVHPMMLGVTIYIEVPYDSSPLSVQTHQFSSFSSMIISPVPYNITLVRLF
jgi:hypothetical protein